MNKILEIEGLSVAVKYRKKMKNIYLRVEKNGDVVVSAPLRTPNYLIKKLVHDNVVEIQKRRANILSNEQTKREFLTGDTFFIFGKELPIEVVLSQKNKVILTGEKIILVIKDSSQDREKIFFKGIREKLKEEAMRFIEKYEVLMGVKANELRIKRMKTRWGTCNIEAKRIWLNEELIKYPISCLEHIVVHELTHLLETNHTKRFYTLLGKYYPNYKENDIVIKEFNGFLKGR